MGLTTILTALALASRALANPVPGSPTIHHDQAVPTEVAIREKLHLGTAHGGALDLPTTVTAAPSKASEAAALDQQLMRVTIINKHGDDISTIPVHGFDSPGAVEGDVNPGRMYNGQTAAFAVPSGWNGNIAINDAAFSDTTGDESLIEGSFVDQGQGYAQSDINISYVNGFSVAIVCWCNENGLTTGCNKNLFSLNQCNNNNGQNSCRNPARFSGQQYPDAFFAPCHGPSGPYTYPDDSQANTLNQVCRNNEFTCCIGEDCDPNPNQASW